MTALTCLACGKTAQVSVETIDGKPLQEWFAGQGQRCTPCFRGSVPARLLPPPEGVPERMEVLMATAASRVDPAWLEAALDTAIIVADRGLPFSCNDIWEAGLEEPPPPQGRALGSQVSKLARGGYIRYTGQMIRSKRGVAHIPVWIKT